MAAIHFNCSCGKITGTVENFSLETSNYSICYCHDCRAFLKWLGRLNLANDAGGTHILQVAQRQVTFLTGKDQIAFLRLTEKGLYRSYSQCCRTPLGNTMSANWAFVGLVTAVFEEKTTNSWPLPPCIFEKSALKPVKISKWIQHAMVFKVTKLMLIWKFKGWQKPSPYFTDGGIIKGEVTILNPYERQKLS